MYQVTFDDKDGLMRSNPDMVQSIARRYGATTDIGERFITFVFETREQAQALRNDMSAWTVATSGQIFLD